MGAIRHTIHAIRQNRNQQQLSVARLNQNFIASNLPKGKVPPEIVELLPHPPEWILFSGDRLTGINKTTALDIHRNFEQLNGEAKSLLEPYMREVEAILRT